MCVFDGLGVCGVSGVSGVSGVRRGVAWGWCPCRKVDRSLAYIAHAFVVAGRLTHEVHEDGRDDRWIRAHDVVLLAFDRDYSGIVIIAFLD